MPELSYDRVVSRLRIHQRVDAGASVRIGRRSCRLDATQLAALSLGDAQPARAALVEQGFLTWWQARPDVAARWQRHLGNLVEVQAVLELFVAPNLAGLPWEAVLRPLIDTGSYGAPTGLVRPSMTPMRAAAWPLVLPIRLLQIGSGLAPLATRTSSLFGWSRSSEQLVLRAASCAAEDVESWWRDTNWPSVDVLELRIPATVRATDLTDAGQPGPTWSLAWLEQLCQEHRTRLVIVTTSDQLHLPPARAMIQRLADRGGPAGLVVSDPAETWLHDFYVEVVHDRPLDWALAHGRVGLQSPPPPMATLMAGWGREDSLRVSAAMRPVVDLASRVETGSTTALDEERWRGQAAATQWTSAADLQGAWGSGSRELLRRWPQVSFDLHEREGVIPMQRAFRTLRRRLGIEQPVVVPRPSPPDRRVVPRLLQADASGVTAVDQRGGHLRARRPVLLSVEIGPGDELIEVAQAVSLLEEAIFRTADEQGAWLEVAVFDLTARVLGERVQQLWLPRTGPSEPVTFVIRQPRQDAWRVRIGIYRDNLLLQSVLVAAAPDLVDERPGRRRLLLARNLGLAPEEITDDLTWYARTEYTLTAGELGDPPPLERRVLSIAANTLDDVPALMFKGHDRVAVDRLPGDVDKTVQLVRDELRRAATPVVDGVILPGVAFYGFGPDNTDTQGRFDEVMSALAWRGSVLYEKLIRQDAREEIDATLGPDRSAAVPGSVINVPHLLIDHVLPWALVYDRSYDPGKTEDADEHPLEHIACRALENGELPQRCGTHPACPLHPDGLRRRSDADQPLVDQETVACPRHFWGFRHVIETPANQPGRPAATVAGDGPVSVGIGLHDGLTFTDRHLDALSALLNTSGEVRWREGRRDALRRLIQDQLDIDLIYLYCHAGTVDGDEVLKVQSAGKPEGLLAATNLGGKRFDHRPLIFVNGCQSVGFSPKTLSPFVTTLITDRAASGLIGTEIDVWEQLATEVATTFLEAFARPPWMAAGPALRRTRLSLLAKGNPLGLIYTLYALADLRLRA
ncbi:MAG TPA: hypothetical protein VIT65_09355 [Microlunatus sp.]